MRRSPRLKEKELALNLIKNGAESIEQVQAGLRQLGQQTLVCVERLTHSEIHLHTQRHTTKNQLLKQRRTPRKSQTGDNKNRKLHSHIQKSLQAAKNDYTAQGEQIIAGSIGEVMEVDLYPHMCSVNVKQEPKDFANEKLDGCVNEEVDLYTHMCTVNIKQETEDYENEMLGGCANEEKLGRLRKKLRKCDDYKEGDKMDAMVQQIIMNPPEVIIKEEAVVQEEAESDVGAGAQQNFEYVSKEEPIEDPDESTPPAPEESSEQMGQHQELPLIIKEEIDCDDYIDPFCIS